MKLRKAIGMSFLLALLTAFSFGCAPTASKPESQATSQSAKKWQFHSIVGVDYVAQFVTIPRPEDVLLVDSRPTRKRYDTGYIPTAINIPDSRFARMTDKLPTDKETLIIFYCQGPICKLSHKSAWKAEKLGYTNVKVFSDGYPAWLKAGHYGAVTAAYLKKQVDKGADIVIIDSRPKRPKYDKGHIPTAISIPDSQFDKFKHLLPEDKSKQLIFYCGGFTCKLSHKSAGKADRMGYTRVKVFEAGYPAWKKLAGTAGKIDIKGGEEEGSIDLAVFKKILAETPNSAMLIDVRDPDEFATGHFKTAVNIPTDQLEQQLKTMKVTKPIIFVCATGARSGEAFYMVQDLRPDIKEVFYVEATITHNSDGSFELKASE